MSSVVSTNELWEQMHHEKAQAEGAQRVQSEGARQADDWLASFAKKSDEALAKRAAEKKTARPPDEKALVEALARKDFVDYDRMRVDVAETLGIRVGTLDDKVEAVRKARSDSDQGSVIVVEDIEPWAESVDGAALLDEMSKAMTAHIAMKETEADTIALWCV